MVTRSGDLILRYSDFQNSVPKPDSRSRELESKRAGGCEVKQGGLF
ncbi:hypothetical protein D3OALGA1CA_3622 [Olavius algarvensis associated proteobacterium Delta 3]|nr:hypothetical protein D3OALGA1CA_3622 [Olavius algarvensis associated proteobacterium Delta 3]CAB5147285.1 hypothetical protein D3OALGB2SA_4584 [Olavius algarvensis associated proteobacterium Delta 3]